MKNIVSEATWELLHSAARAAALRAYCPYSNYPVGAAALVDDGRIIDGCNVENASYGMTLCAECAVICSLINGGGGQLRALVCVNGTGEALAPCGRCRQLLWEHGGPELLLKMPVGIQNMAQILPGAFGADDLIKPEKGAL